MKYEVMEIVSEKKLNGNSNITVRSIEDDSIVFTLALPSETLDNRELLLMKVDTQYRKIIEYTVKDKEYSVKVGDILAGKESQAKLSR